jgi:hypothetical protein
VNDEVSEGVVLVLVLVLAWDSIEEPVEEVVFNPESKLETKSLSLG